MQPKDLDGLPEPARRYLARAIAPGTPDATTARIRMNGSIKLGNRWLRFRARETLTPHEGFVWKARVGRIFAGSDSLVDSKGTLDWKFLGLIRAAHAVGPDISRSAAGRAASEAIWVPTALLPRFGVEWSASDDTHATARFAVGDVEIQLHLETDADGQVVSLLFDRWGDPRLEGTFADHPFGMEVTDYATFDGVTVPSAGRAGWDFGTDGWEKGEFFRYRITALTLENVPNAPSN